jgi:hypothetical protein
MERFDSFILIRNIKKNMEMQILHCNGANLLMVNRPKNLTGMSQVQSSYAQYSFVSKFLSSKFLSSKVLRLRVPTVECSYDSKFLQLQSSYRSKFLCSMFLWVQSSYRGKVPTGSKFLQLQKFLSLNVPTPKT